MKKTLIAALILAGIFLISGGAVFGQTSNANAEFDKDVSLLRKDLRSDRKQFVALNLTLTDVEATKFWPIFDKYTAEQKALYDSRLALIKEYADNFDNMTDAKAANLNQRNTQVDQAFATLRLKYVPLVDKVLPGRKSVLFFQLDRRLCLLIDLQIASEVPILIQ